MLYKELESITTNSKYVTRHIVPFGFSSNGDVKEYDKIVSHLKMQEKAAQKSAYFVLQPECRDKDSDIYEYLHNLYNNTPEFEEKSIGSVWEYKNPELKDVHYVYSEKKSTNGKSKGNKSSTNNQEKLYVRISDAGMYLMKTGIGLFWYELRHYKSFELMKAIEAVEARRNAIRTMQWPENVEEENKLWEKLEEEERLLEQIFQPYYLEQIKIVQRQLEQGMKERCMCRSREVRDFRALLEELILDKETIENKLKFLEDLQQIVKETEELKQRLFEKAKEIDVSEDKREILENNIKTLTNFVGLEDRKVAIASLEYDIKLKEINAIILLADDDTQNYNARIDEALKRLVRVEPEKVLKREETSIKAPIELLKSKISNGKAVNLLEQKKKCIKQINNIILRLEQKNATDLKTILDFQNMMKELARPHYEILYKKNEIEQAKSCVLGKWVADVLGELNSAKIEYFPERYVDEEGTTYDLAKMTKANVSLVDVEAVGCVPDKAILFSCVEMEEAMLENGEVDKRDTLETIAYHMALGYDGKYKVESHVKAEMSHPYDNIVQFIKKEGFAECVSFTEDNKTFFVNRKLKHFRTDYFHMYMHLLQQSYSVLNMTKELSTTLSANHETYKKGGKAISAKIEEIEARINLFLIKNKKASVSHVENQNDFYTYVEKGLHIKEDIEALSSGVGTLGEIIMRRDAKVEQSKAEQMESAFTILSIVSIVSIFMDFTDVHKLFTIDNVPWMDVHTKILIAVGILGLMVIIHARYSIIKFLWLDKIGGFLFKTMPQKVVAFFESMKKN